VNRPRTDTARGFRSRFGVPAWTILVFWVVFGLVIGNQIIASMPTHGHSWWKMAGWQLGAAMGWAVLTPLVLRLGMRRPLEPRLPVVFGHLLLGFGVAALHVLHTTLLSLAIDPYTPIREALPFLDEYKHQFDCWALLDVVLYFGLVALGTGIETRRRQLREARLRADLAKAELRALRLELQPHFLFNALNAVAGLLRRGAHREAEEMLIGLSELLRATLDGSGRQLVPVSEEIRVCELYLDVQKVRFGERLRVLVDVDPSTRDLAVPNLLLQPIVENAIRHGIAPRAAGGTLAITTHLEGERLVLRVRDDGPGLPPSWPDGGATGHGLGHVISRLEAVYGDDWELDLRDQPEGGVAVEVEVPAHPVSASVAARPAEPEETAREHTVGAPTPQRLSEAP
jgi:signal transduction histidine kinase